MMRWMYNLAEKEIIASQFCAGVKEPQTDSCSLKLYVLILCTEMNKYTKTIACYE